MIVSTVSRTFAAERKYDDMVRVPSGIFFMGSDDGPRRMSVPCTKSTWENFSSIVIK